MRTNPTIQTSALLGVIILLAVLAAGCASPSGTAPATVQATTVPTTVPATTLPATSLTTPPPATTSPVPATPTAVLPAATTAAPAIPTTPSPVAVTIQNFAFNPSSVTVPAGTTVTWTNQDSAAHQIASDTQVFSSIALGQGGTYSFTFMNPGTYPYHCPIHPFMTGKVIVT